MKTNIIQKIGVIVILVLLLSSCNKWIDTDINIDPNNPRELSLNLVLPTIQAGLAYQIGGDFSRPVCIWMQQYSGISNQAIAYDVYNFTQSDVNNVWEWGMYAGPLKDLKRMITEAEESKSPHYQGIAEILMAYGIGTMTDLFGDMPYSEAWNDEILQPKFDSQQSIYNEIFRLLNAAISHLNETESVFSPADDDLIYSGDLSLWIKAAYTLKARYYLHLSKVNGAAAYDSALTSITNGFSSNDEDLEVYFGENQNEWNPAFQFFYYDRSGDIVLGAFFTSKLKTDNDPRLPLFIDTTGYAKKPSVIDGSNPGMADGSANPGAYYHSQSSPVPLISYVEAKFIEAEARLQTSDAAGAATAYNDAVQASLNKIGVSSATFTAAVTRTAGNITLADIINQKYIALFTQPEIFVDYRRTGYPSLTPPANAKTIDKKIPRRWPYPTSERNYNSNNFEPYKNITLSDPLWWDK
jgi:hypothetical protein